MILSVVNEVLELKERAPKWLLRDELVYAKVALFVVSIFVPFLLPLWLALLYLSLLLAALAIVGLRLTALYVVATFLLLYLSMALSAAFLGGSLEGVGRFSATAASTLSAFLLFLSTTKPSSLRRWAPLYLLWVIFNDVLREVVDISIVFKAKGSSGLKYWLRVITASIAASLSRAEALRDSLRARGVELEPR